VSSGVAGWSRFDLAVVGGGPVGLATAIEAALAGWSVAVLEPRVPPVDKACGEGLMPAARTALARLGVDPPGMPFRGIEYRTPVAAAVAEFRAGPGLGVRRTELSTALWDRALDVGVEHVPVRAGRPTTCDDGIRVAGVRGDGAPGEAARGEAGPVSGVEARWLVAADGLHSPIRRSLGLTASGPSAARDPAGGRVRYGLRRHYRIAPWNDLVEVHWAADCEAYVTPVAPDLVGVAVLGPGGAPFDTWLDRFPVLRSRLESAAEAGPVRGAGPLRQTARRRVSGRVLLVGDAAGYVDALTGEGLAVGLACARELVGCLRAGRPEDYERAWRRATRRYRVLTGGLLLAAGRPRLRRAIVPAAQRLPRVFAEVVNQLGRG
jgi:flavin-dependent dehydrogenase